MVALLLVLCSCGSSIFGDGEHDYRYRLEFSWPQKPLTIVRVDYVYDPDPDLSYPDVLSSAVAHWQSTGGWLFATQDQAIAAQSDSALRKSPTLKKVIIYSGPAFHSVYWLMPEVPGGYSISYLGLSPMPDASTYDSEEGLAQAIESTTPPAGRAPVTATVSLVQ